MKLLSTEQQTNLRDIFDLLEANIQPAKAVVEYWRKELKPKRPRRKPVQQELAL